MNFFDRFKRSIEPSDIKPIEAAQILRVRILAEQKSLVAQQRSRAEVEAEFNVWVDGVAQEGQEALIRGLQSLAAGHPFPGILINGSAEIHPGSASYLAPVECDLSPLMVALVGREVIRKNVSPLFANIPDGLSSKDRAARLEQLSKDLLACELREEVAIRRAEQSTGEPIARRDDTNPAIYLALEV